MSKRSAIIDLGTNTFQLLICQKGTRTGSMEIICTQHAAVQLGKGAMETNALQQDAMDRAMLALVTFKDLAQSHGCDLADIKGVGTSILRNASNARDFISKVRSDIGIKIDVISGLAEADLIFQGIVQSLPEPWDRPSLVMDIGGGSVEFILFQHKEVLYKTSLELGGLKLQSLFHVDGEFNVAIKHALDAYIGQAIDPLIKVCEIHRPQVLIGAAGAFETILDLELAYTKREVDALPACTLDIKQFYATKARIESLDYHGRVHEPGMRAFRAGIFPYANCLVANVLACTGIEAMWMSRYSLKEGYWFQNQD